MKFRMNIGQLRTKETEKVVPPTEETVYKAEFLNRTNRLIKRHLGHNFLMFPLFVLALAIKTLEQMKVASVVLRPNEENLR